MPPNPIAPASKVSQTCGRRNADSSRRPVAAGSPGTLGTNSSTRAIVSRPRIVTDQYAERQPKFWPSQVAAGTPTTLATDSPSMTSATARPRRSGVARFAATSDATPK